jgi:hypothetical protein
MKVKDTVTNNYLMSENPTVIAAWKSDSKRFKPCKDELPTELPVRTTSRSRNTEQPTDTTQAQGLDNDND